MADELTTADILKRMAAAEDGTDAKMRRQIQAQAMAGRPLTSEQEAFLAKKLPEKEARSERLGVPMAYAAELTGVPQGIRAASAIGNAFSDPTLSNAGDAALQTGLAALPFGAGVVQRGASALGRMLTARPILSTAALTTSGLAAAPSEAGEGKAKDYVPPSLLQEVTNTAKSFFGGDSKDTDKPMTADEYKASRRSIQPKTLEAILAEEKAKVKEDPTYQYGPRQRAALDKKAEETAQKRYEASKGDLTEQEKRLDESYNSYRQGWNTQRAEHMDKQFTERHPKTAMAMTVGGPILSGLLTRGVFGKINSKGDEIVAAGNTARASDNMRSLADQIKRADSYVWRSNVGKGVAATEAAAIPAELRMMQDVIDKKGLPPDAGARKAADARMSNLPEYAKGMGYDLFSGAVGTGSGALWSKFRAPFPGADLATLRSHAAGMDRGNMAPDAMAQALAQRAILARQAQAQLNASPPAMPVNNAPAPPQALPPAPPAPIAPAQGGALVPQGTLGGTASVGPAAIQGPPPSPASASNQPTLASTLSGEKLAKILEQEQLASTHHANFQPRGKNGEFKKGKPKTPDTE